jgi:hypothetical protein
VSFAGSHPRIRGSHWSPPARTDLAPHPARESGTDPDPREIQPSRRGRSRRRGSLATTLAVWWNATDLDRRLAAGDDPRSTDALALRARRILTRRSRSRLAGGLAGAMGRARAGGSPFTAAVTPRSRDVLEARTVIAALERELRGDQPVAARGVAMVRLLLVDGNGPLYRPSPPGLLGSRLRAAAAALRPQETAAP